MQVFSSNTCANGFFESKGSKFLGLNVEGRAIGTINKLFGKREDLTLLHVSEEIIVYGQSGIVNYEAIENIESERSNEILNEFENTFKNEGITCKKILRTGNPIDVVLEIANEYDLLAL